MSLLTKGLPRFVPPVFGCWAILQAVNVGAVKPATVRRNWQGTDYTLDCYITQHVRDEWVAGRIAIGDYVLVEYLDQDPDRAGVVAKIVKTW
ncbi:MAG: hypothetical protein HYX80_01830 [Chloroflexi bacterium]|nr:hypothetical protein [Chloroflexota bacterium]